MSDVDSCVGVGDEVMTQSTVICLDCRRTTAGRCWRHRNAVNVNVQPAPSPGMLANLHELLGRLAAADASVRERPDVRALLDEYGY